MWLHFFSYLFNIISIHLFITISLLISLYIYIANATVSLITAMISIILWSGEMKINEEGGAVEFRDYFDRDDLEDMQVMISTQVRAGDKNANFA